MNFEFESAHELLMNLNLNSTFAKSMNLNLVFSKSMNLNLNLKITKKMNGSNPSNNCLIHNNRLRVIRSKRVTSAE